MVKKVCELVMHQVMNNRHKKANAHVQVEAMIHKVEVYEQEHQVVEAEHNYPKPSLEVPHDVESFHTDSEAEEEEKKDG